MNPLVLIPIYINSNQLNYQLKILDTQYCNRSITEILFLAETALLKYN